MISMCLKVYFHSYSHPDYKYLTSISYPTLSAVQSHSPGGEVRNSARCSCVQDGHQRRHVMEQQDKNSEL